MSDAAVIDPQQRHLLMHTYKALENAGIPMEKVAGTKTSVFSGSFCVDWLLMSYMDTATNKSTTGLGVGPAVLSNRISWFFDFIGNSATIDTACSSSLVCLDLGCQNLLLKESNMSIVTGSNILLSPDAMHSLTNMNMISPDGQCYSFDHRSNGYGRGEGIGVLVLKRLSDAVRDCDTIRGIIRSTGCNQDGRVSGITLPNHASHTKLITDTYRKAGLSMEPVRFFEAHGTGTPVGDPIETQAIGEAFKGIRTIQDPLWVGSVKSNIGHLEGASGIAGVVKAILALERGIIPPNTNFEKTNPKIDTDFLRIQFPLASMPWPTRGLRRASVNSFGFTGTNAHVVLDDVFHYLEDQNIKANHLTVKDPPNDILDVEISNSTSRAVVELVSDIQLQNTSRPKLLVLSANDKAGIQRLSTQYAVHFQKLLQMNSLSDKYLDHLSYTLSDRRSQLAWRSHAIIKTVQDLTRLNHLVVPATKYSSVPRLGFVFSGQGAQWIGMGRALATKSVFVQSLQMSEQFLAELGCTWNLRDKIWTEESADLSSSELSQPICTALQIALVDLLRTYEIFPSAVVGHSSGEIAAAYCVGALSHHSAIAVAYHRGRLCGSLAIEGQFDGAMLAVALGPSNVEPYMRRVREQSGFSDLTVACLNSHKNVTISGTKKYIDALSILLHGDGIFCRLLRVNVAYHSSHTKHVAEMYRDSIKVLEKSLVPSKPAPAFISSLHGELVHPEELVSPQYWMDNLVSPVRFSDSIQKLLVGSGEKVHKKLDLSHRRRFQISMIVEVGPHSVLQGPIKEIVAEIPSTSSIKYTSVLIRNSAADESLLTAVGQIHSFGYPVDLLSVNSLSTVRNPYIALPDLPCYAFDQSKRYWFENRFSSHNRLGSQGKIDLLGKPVIDWNPLEPKWRNFLRISEMPWMEDHSVGGMLIYPGAGMAVMAIEAANQLTAHIEGVEGFSLRNIAFVGTLNVPQDADGIETYFTMSLAHNELQPLSKWTRWRLLAYEQGTWIECCHGEVRANLSRSMNGMDGTLGEIASLDSKMARARRIADSNTKTVDPEMFYEKVGESGLKFGPAFQRIAHCKCGEDNETIASVRPFQWPAEQYPQAHVIHPTTLDGIFQIGIGVHLNGGSRRLTLAIPSFLRYLKVSKTGAFYIADLQTLHGCAWLDSFHARGIEFSGFALDSLKQRAVVEFEGLKSIEIAKETAGKALSQPKDQQIVYSLQYTAEPTLIHSETMSLYFDQNRGIHKTALAHYIALQAHRNPNLNVLVINICNTYVVSDTFSTLWGRHQDRAPVVASLGSLHVAAEANSVWEEVRIKAAEDSIFVQHPIGSMNTFFNDHKTTGFFNMVLLQMDALQDKPLLKQIRGALRNDGELVLVQSCGIDGCTDGLVADNGWSCNLVECGFESRSRHLVDDRIQNGSSVHMQIIKTLPKQLPMKHVNPIYLVADLTVGIQVQTAHHLASSLRVHNLSINDVITLAKAAELSKEGNGIFIVLLEYERPLLYQISAPIYSQIQQFLTHSSDIIWINAVGGSDATPPEHNMIVGMARVLRNELERFRITILSLESSGLPSEKQVGHVAKILLRNHTDHNSVTYDGEYLEINGELTVPRLVPEYELAENFRLRATTHRSSITTINDELPLALSDFSENQLQTIHFTYDELHKQPLREDEIQIQVKAFGMDAKDTLAISRRHSNRSHIYECSGIVIQAGSCAHLRPGDRVLTTTSLPPRTHVRVKASRAILISDQISHTIAAATSVEFCTAWAIVHRLAQLQKYEVVLVHAAAISHGQAIIQMAQQIGAEIYCMVKSLKEQQLLVDEYGLSKSSIFVGESDDFATRLRYATGGSGVDVMVNCAGDELTNTALDCLRPLGRFIEVGRREDASDLTIPHAAFQKGISFHNFNFITWSQMKLEQYKSDMKTVLGLLVEGKLKPISPLRVFAISEVQQAYESVEKFDGVGKVLLEVTPTSQVLARLKSSASFKLNPNATYVIAGGLGGIGRTTARWMADRGARSLVLLSRFGPRNDNAHVLVKELTTAGVLVQTPACDVSDLEQLTNFFSSVKDQIPPVKGCVQATVAGRNCLLKDMNFEDWKASVECKSTGSFNLHSVLPRGMDFFILLSSVSGILGLRGQSNYNAGNAYKDAFARWRVSQGERAIALNLGALIDDGILVENPELLKRVLAYGSVESVTREKYLGLLDYYCDPSQKFSSPAAAQIVVGVSLTKGNGLETLDLSRQALLLPVLHIGRSQANVTAQEDKVNSKTLFATSESLGQASHIVSEAIRLRLSHSLSSMQEDSVDLNQQLTLQGVDSILAVELRDWISKEFASELAVFETQGAATLNTLSMQVASRSALPHPNWTLIDSE